MSLSEGPPIIPACAYTHADKPYPGWRVQPRQKEGGQAPAHHCPSRDPMVSTLVRSVLNLFDLV